MIFHRFFIGGAGCRGGEERHSPSWERRIREGRGEVREVLLDGYALERRERNPREKGTAVRIRVVLDCNWQSKDEDGGN